MYGKIQQHLQQEIATIQENGLFKKIKETNFYFSCSRDGAAHQSDLACFV